MVKHYRHGLLVMEILTVRKEARNDQNDQNNQHDRAKITNDFASLCNCSCSPSVDDGRIVSTS